MIFNSKYNPAEIYSPPEHISDEPISNFPLKWYEEFLQRLIDLEIEVITYRDLFDGSDDWNYRSNYKREFINWSKTVCDPNKRYLLIQHDVDNHPFFTKRMVAMEAVYGIRSNIFIFRHRYSSVCDDPPYEIDHEFFQEAQKREFVIGYHQNALPLAGFDVKKAIERYGSDVLHLRQLYDIEFVVPHGGVGVERDGRKIHNLDVPMPPEYEGNLRWVYNRYGAKFTKRWSDGGLRKTRDPKRIEGFDLVGKFLPSLKPGTRNFCLIHPQRWGYNVDPQQNLMLAEQAWYKQVCSKYSIPNPRDQSRLIS
ncbi:MAG: hypothetical protein IH984_01775 [Planctomycetes bacterium]|nr:hypothetical protein [Planctomycetota bacterium]